MSSLGARLAKLAVIWPREPCPLCRDRPAVLFAPDEDAPLPEVLPYGPCPGCGRLLYDVPILVGVAEDAI